jgi:hypothetical protein
VVIWCVFLRFGILCREKSGNPESVPLGAEPFRTERLYSNLMHGGGVEEDSRSPIERKLQISGKRRSIPSRQIETSFQRRWAAAWLF